MDETDRSDASRSGERASATDDPGLRVRRVLETCLYAHDLAATAAFYGEVLGLDEVSRVKGRHVFFRCGHQMVLLFHPETTSTPDGTLPPHGTSGAGHVAFAVSLATMDAWAEHLRAHDVDIEAEMSWGDEGRSIYVRDPAGNSVELATPGIWPLPAPGAE